jgi:hypothetical protein
MWWLDRMLPAVKAATLLIAALIAVLLSSPTHVAANGSSFPLIKTISGKVYTNCRVFKTDPDGVIIAHQEGGAKLLFADMPEETREMLGYDAKKEAAYEKQRAEARVKEREELWKYRRELAQAQAAAYAAEAKRLEMVTVQNIATGGGYGGYGFGWDGGYGWGGYGYSPGWYGNPWGSGFGFGCDTHLGKGFGFGHGHGFAFSPYHRFARIPFYFRGGTTLPTPANFGTMNTKGRTFVGPRPRSGSVGTPAMGRLTRPLGSSGRK